MTVRFQVLAWDKPLNKWTLAGNYLSMKGALKKQDALMRNGVKVRVDQIMPESKP